MVKMPHWPLYFGPDTNIFESVNRMKKMLSILGNPELKLKNIIHVTGTKGKGSTCVYIDSILRSSGFNVNLYTSPHIYDTNERFLINGLKISDDDLYYYTEIVRRAFDASGFDFISSFEAMTLTAFLKFADTSADVNIIEVGMGGMYDATNVFDENLPFACVFCPIHLDHKIFLGDHPLKITYHKLGILKNGIKNAVIAQQSTDVNEYIEANLKKLSIENYYFYGLNFEPFETEEMADKFIFESKLLKNDIILDKPILPGDHQIKNISTAIQVCLLFNKNISNELINSACKKIIHFTRMQEIKKKEFLEILPRDSKIFVDGGHNKLAAIAILDFVKRYKKNHNFQFVCIVVARSKNVDNLDMLSVFKNNLVDEVFAIRANEARSEPPEKIKLAGELINLKVITARSVEECLFSISRNKNSKCLVIFCGSLYLGRYF